MIKNILVSIVRTVVDRSNDILSATAQQSSNQLEPTVVLDKQPTFLYSKESLEELKKIYPKKQWSKDIDITELAHNAGQQDIISFIERRLGKEQHRIL
jgi:hypothetical protein